MANVFKNLQRAIKKASKAVDRTWDENKDKLRVDLGKVTDWADEKADQFRTFNNQNVDGTINAALQGATMGFKSGGLYGALTGALIGAGGYLSVAALADIIEDVGEPGDADFLRKLMEVADGVRLTYVAGGDPTDPSNETVTFGLVDPEGKPIIGLTPSDVMTALDTTEHYMSPEEIAQKEQAVIGLLQQTGLVGDLNTLTDGFLQELTDAVKNNPDAPFAAIADAVTGGKYSDFDLLRRAAEGDITAQNEFFGTLGDYLTGGLVTPSEALYNLLDDNPENDAAAWQELVSGLQTLAHDGWDPVTSTEELTDDATNYINDGWVDDIINQNLSPVIENDAPEFDGSEKVFGLTEDALSQLAEKYPEAVATLYSWDLLPDSVKASLDDVTSWIEDLAASASASPTTSSDWLDPIGELLTDGWESAAAQLPSLQPIADAIEESTDAAADFTEEEVVDPTAEMLDDIQLPAISLSPYEQALNTQLLELENAQRTEIDWDALQDLLPQDVALDTPPVEEIPLDLELPEAPVTPLPDTTLDAGPESPTPTEEETIPLSEGDVEEGPPGETTVPGEDTTSADSTSADSSYLDEAALAALLASTWNSWSEEVPEDVLAARRRASDLLSGEDLSWQDDARYQSAVQRATRLDDALGYSGSNTAMINQTNLAHDAIMNAHLDALWRGYGDAYWSDAAMAQRRYKALLDAAAGAGFYFG